MSKVLKELLSQCEYALGEAKTNTSILIENAEKEEDEDLQLSLEEDYNYFEELQRQIREKLFDSRRQKEKRKKHIKG